MSLTTVVVVVLVVGFTVSVIWGVVWALRKK
jgi:hypothetical protein